MNTIMRQAIEELQKLPEEEQKRFAEFILAELESEARWDALFAKSEDFLDQLADEIIAEHRAGKTKELDPKSKKAFMND